MRSPSPAQRATLSALLHAALDRRACARCLQAGLSTTLRCAGGWVRDKLMGRTSLDIDIALDNLMGREFADRVNEHLKAHVRKPAPRCSRRRTSPASSPPPFFPFSTPAAPEPSPVPQCQLAATWPASWSLPACLQGEETHHVAVIMSNPEQSKHLETARMKASAAAGARGGRAGRSQTQTQAQTQASPPAWRAAMLLGMHTHGARL